MTVRIASVIGVVVVVATVDVFTFVVVLFVGVAIGSIACCFAVFISGMVASVAVGDVSVKVSPFIVITVIVVVFVICWCILSI